VGSRVGGWETLERPRLRGVFHQYAFFLSLVAGAVFVLGAPTSRARLAAAIFAATVSIMLGTSALYHRLPWTPRAKRRMRRLDHVAIFLLIAGTYTPFGLLVLSGSWRISVLAVVWSGALLAIVLQVSWIDSPTWIAAVLGIALGWVGVVTFPQLLDKAGIVPSALLLAGGLLYTAGAVVYALRRPNPRPLVFGFHEIFHLLVIAAVVCQYVAVGFFVFQAK